VVIRATTKEASLLLHNVRSAHNVGAIFRTADAAGIAKIYLSGYTPTPLDRFGRARPDVAKAALGAETHLPWEQISSPATFLKKKKQEGIFTVAIEQDASAVDYRKLTVRFPVLFVLGNEVRGLSPSLRNLCDMIAEIPMYGKKESLNVSVSAGVALFRILHP